MILGALLALLEFSSLVSAFSVNSWADRILHNNDTFKAIKVEDYSGESCYRKCSESDSRVCYFKFVMEHYHAMGPACGNCANGVFEDCFKTHCLTADGYERGVMSINRLIPGPQIHVCQDDLIVVDVVNQMAGTSTTLHWHGLHMRDTPFMDGVPYITQCPISFSQHFRYSFWATEPGTQFYHSHSGHHKTNGHYGALIIRKPGESEDYDFDLPQHTLLISDWMHHYGEMFAPGLPTRGPGIIAVNALVNGKGRFGEGSNATKSPIEVFKVRSGFKYRFRFINSASHVCPVQIQIKNHRLRVVATDSFDVKPEEVDTLLSTSGERFDFIVDADQTPGSYCLVVKLLGMCESRGVKQIAVLHYSDSTDHSVSVEEYEELQGFYESCRGEEIDIGRTLNHPNTTKCDNFHKASNQDICTSHLERAIEIHSVSEREEILMEEHPEVHEITFDNYKIPNEELFVHDHYHHFMNNQGNLTLVAALNNISTAFPPFSPLTQLEDWDDDSFCNKTHWPPSCTGKRYCHCVHRIKVSLNSIVELQIIDVTSNVSSINHPFHLHGFPMYLTKMGRLQEDISLMSFRAAREDVSSILNTKKVLSSSPLKDTISIPSKGYTYVRFKADNPGFWLLHCHFEYHMSIGMGLVVQVGEKEDFVKAPKNFPTCGSYTPDIDETVLRYRNTLPRE